MGTLLAVTTFLTIVAVIGVLRTDDEQAADFAEFADSPRRTPDPSPRDIHALTGTLGAAPVPNWG